jgi:hypothetical protein
LSSIPALLAIAAGLLLAAGLTYTLYVKTTSVWRMAGHRIAVGQTIETGPQAGAQIEAKDVGQVELDPNSRLQILPAARGNQQFALRRGTMHALIWAPPSRFVVETPSAKTIDLGCAYTLTVLSDDSGLLKVDARQRDSLTLWHLIVRTSGSDHDLVVHRFAGLVPGADLAGLEAGDGSAIDHAWNLLGLGRTEWWRMWKHAWQS